MGEEVLGGLAGALGLPRHEGAELRVRVHLFSGRDKSGSCAELRV